MVEKLPLVKYLSLVFLPSIFLFGQSVILDESSYNVSIGGYTKNLEDVSSVKTIQEVLQSHEFQATVQESPNFGATNSAYWLKFSVHNRSHKVFYLEVGSAFLDEVTLYQVHQGEIDYQKHTGDHTLFSTREVHSGNYLFKLEIPKGEIRDYYLRVKSTQPLFFPLRIGSFESFVKSGHQRDFFQGMYFGFMLLMFLYNFFLYLTIRERVYLYYIGYVMSITWFMASVFGYFFEFLWPNTPVVNQYVVISSGLTIATATLFTKQFLNLKELSKKLYIGAQIFVGAGFLVCLFILLGLRTVGLQLAQIGLLLMSLYFILLGFVSLKSGFGPAKYYLIAWGSLATGIFFAILESLSVIPVMHSINAIQIGSGLEVLMLSFALGDRINSYKKQQEEATELALQKSREHEELVIKQNLTLELKVEERTKELTEERDKLKAANKTKTRFFSIISHDLRSPMSAMYGLSELLSNHLKKTYGINKDKQMDELISHLNASSNQVFRLLDSLLQWALKEEGVIPYNPEVTALKELIAENMKIIDSQAVARSINLETDIADDLKVWVDKHSFSTILRNLTSNSLKFTHRGGRINISAREMEVGMVLLEIKDTGIGIPEEKLQSLFEINETKVRKGVSGEMGTGLGLNLVYDFVKMNKGTIEVKSKEGQGTIFSIRLPIPQHRNIEVLTDSN